MPHATIPPRAFVLLGVLTLVWGTNWPLFPIVLKEMSIWHFRGVSLVGGGLVLLAWAKATGKAMTIPRAHWPVVLVAAATYLAVWNVASATAAALIPSGQAAILGFTMPLWVALLAWAFLGQRLTPRLMVAVLLSACAVALLMVPSFKAYAQAPLGLALGLLAGLGWAVGTLIIKRWPVPRHPAVVTGWQLLITAAVVMVASLAFESPPRPAPSAQVWLLVVYITLVPMAIGNLTWFTLVELLPAQVAGLSSILVPMVAMVSGAWLHGEPLGLLQWLAMACCAASLWLATRRA